MTRVNFHPYLRQMNFDKFFNEMPNNLDFMFNRFPKVDLVEDKNSVNIIAEFRITYYNLMNYRNHLKII